MLKKKNGNYNKMIDFFKRGEEKEEGNKSYRYPRH